MCVVVAHQAVSSPTGKNTSTSSSSSFLSFIDPRLIPISSPPQSPSEYIHTHSYTVCSGYTQTYNKLMQSTPFIFTYSFVVVMKDASFFDFLSLCSWH